MEKIEHLHDNPKQLKELVNRLRDEIDILLEVTTVIGKSLNLESAITNILEIAKKVIPFETASLQVLNGDFSQVIGGIGFRSIQEIKKLRFPYPREGSLSTAALQSGKPMMTIDVEKDFPSFIQPPNTNKIRSWMGIPLVMNDEPIGLITLDSSEKDHFSQHHLKLAGLIASPLAIALENAQIHERSFKMAMTDPLTQLGSRYRFEQEGRLLLDFSKRNQKCLSVVMLDVDNFKGVNDNFGHKVGDEILQLLADLVKNEIRTTDLVCRFGGDEFVFIFPDSDETAVMANLKRITTFWSKKSHPKINEPITLSFGIYSKIPDNNTTLDHIVSKADKALYDVSIKPNTSVTKVTESSSIAAEEPNEKYRTISEGRAGKGYQRLPAIWTDHL